MADPTPEDVARREILEWDETERAAGGTTKMPWEEQRERLIGRVARVLAEQERGWRQGLWLGHGHLGLYGDDGEMQCARCRVDYKRDTPERIIEAVTKCFAEQAREREKERTEMLAIADRIRQELDDKAREVARLTRELEEASHRRNEDVAQMVRLHKRCEAIERATREAAARLVERAEFLEDCKIGACDHPGPNACFAVAIRARAAAQGASEPVIHAPTCAYNQHLHGANICDCGVREHPTAP